MFRPNGRLPGIIIEVIREHPPEEKTFGQLLSLSQSANIVFFYLIDDKKFDTHFNRVFFNNGYLIRFNFYMMGGKLFESGIEIPWIGGSIAERHQQCLLVLGSALAEFEKR
jgi:hypothetical protein